MKKHHNRDNPYKVILIIILPEEYHLIDENIGM